MSHYSVPDQWCVYARKLKKTSFWRDFSEWLSAQPVSLKRFVIWEQARIDCIFVYCFILVVIYQVSALHNKLLETIPSRSVKTWRSYSQINLFPGEYYDHQHILNDNKWMSWGTLSGVEYSAVAGCLGLDKARVASF